MNNMFFTRKGDNGETSFFHCDQRFSKSSELAEALGAVDEINSLLGFCKVKSGDLGFKICDLRILEIINQVQQDLFIIQASLSGADKKLSEEKIKKLEKIIDAAEKEMPEIKSFFISGGTELSALFDYARAVCRSAERAVVSLKEKEPEKVSPEILSYLNRLSSLLYALARFVNFKAKIEEQPPLYE
ncbi:cob(I)yrinic acid a,c-diamide adenosyltransferase [Candidatus Wolfebacteria bacterium]|nr:cob(I)yrinic acid a,c-diamide adenosyltransferase [Candidatus Wolfebacteria bacterium]